MKMFSVLRTGMNPLHFRGELVSAAMGELEEERRHNIVIYKTQAESYVVHIAYRTDRQEESSWDWAWSLETPKQVVEVLEKYDPTRRVVGYPKQTRYEHDQTKLLHRVCSQYNQKVTDVLSGNEVFAEIVE